VTARSIVLILLLSGAPGCRLEMHDQPKRAAYQSSRFFPDHAASRPLVAGTVPRGALRTNGVFYAGLRGTNLVEEIPIKLTRELVERGHERFDIYCSVCHGSTGDGNGIIVHRGFPLPPSFHTDRLREAPIGHFYRVITYGYGIMFSYAARVPPEDRWAIAAYIRALQLSTTFKLAELPESARAKLEGETR
jgi:mono/diheme cytochrome c family protein